MFSFSGLSIQMIMPLLYVASFIVYLFISPASSELAFFFVVLYTLQNIIWLLLLKFYTFNHKLILFLVFLSVFVCCLFSTPLYENDFFRYFYDGNLGLQGINPYAVSPDDLDIKSLQWLKKQMSFQKNSTIYPPASQLLFTAISYLSSNNLRTFNFLLSSLGFLFFFFSFLRFIDSFFPKLPKNTIYLYLMHPLFLKEWLQSAHLDSFLVASTLFCLSSSSRLVQGIWLGIASGFKLSAVLVGSYFLELITDKNYKDLLSLIAGFSLSISILSAYYYKFIFNFLSSFLAFSSKWEMNSGLYRWLRAGASLISMDKPAMAAKLACISLLIISLVFIRKTTKDPLKLTFWIFYILLVLAPVSNPWYYTWILPLTLALNKKSRFLILIGLSALPLSYAAYLPQSFPIHFLHFWNIEHIILITCGLVAYKSDSPSRPINHYSVQKSFT